MAVQKRNAELDFLRVAATVAVVIIHTCAALVLSRPLGSHAWWFGNIVDSFARWSVPVFVMLSGALLIGPKATQNPGTFLKRRFSRIGVPLIAWPILYVIWELALNSIPFHYKQFQYSLLAGIPAPGHLYFLFIIGGLYILTPVISAAVTTFNRRQLWIGAVSLMILTAMWHASETFIVREGAPIDAFTQCLPYIGYYLLGYLLWTQSISKSLNKYFWAAFVISSALIAVTTYKLIQAKGIGQGLYFYNFPTPFVMIASVSIFIASQDLYLKLTSRLAAAKRATLEKYLVGVSATTFGVYLIHPAVRDTVALNSIISLGTGKGFILLTPIIILFSYVLVVLIRKTPVLKLLIP